MSDILDEKKVNKAIAHVLKVLNKHHLNIPELIVLYGSMGYHIGASMAGLNKIGQGPGLEELKREYYSNPTIDVGLMLQGLIITQWEKDYFKSPKLSKFAKDISKKE